MPHPLPHHALPVLAAVTVRWPCPTPPAPCPPVSSQCPICRVSSQCPVCQVATPHPACPVSSGVIPVSCLSGGRGGPQLPAAVLRAAHSAPVRAAAVQRLPEGAAGPAQRHRHRQRTVDSQQEETLEAGEYRRLVRERGVSARDVLCGRGFSVSGCGFSMYNTPALNS